MFFRPQEFYAHGVDAVRDGLDKLEISRLRNDGISKPVESRRYCSGALSKGNDVENEIKVLGRPRIRNSELQRLSADQNEIGACATQFCPQL